MTRPDRRTRRRASANLTACGLLRRYSLERPEPPRHPHPPLPRAPMRISPYRMAAEPSGRDFELGLCLGDNRACPRQAPEQGDRNGHGVSHWVPGRRVRSISMIDQKPPARPASYEIKIGLVLPHAPVRHISLSNSAHHKVLRSPLRVTATRRKGRTHVPAPEGVIFSAAGNGRRQRICRNEIAKAN
jgi:hypothetical protein